MKNKKCQSNRPKYNFSQLTFGPHSLIPNGQQAKMCFPNGYSASVVTGSSFFYISNDAPYELAVMYNDTLVYDTPITDDVIGNLTEEEVTKLLNKISKLPKKGK